MTKTFVERFWPMAAWSAITLATVVWQVGEIKADVRMNAAIIQQHAGSKSVHEPPDKKRIRIREELALRDKSIELQLKHLSAQIAEIKEILGRRNP